jgi:hypothetical protein
MVSGRELAAPVQPQTLERNQNMVIRVSLAFASLPDKELDNFAIGVHNGLDGNADYPAPSVTPADLDTARKDFSQKLSAAAAGGEADTAAKNVSRQALIGLLRDLANYVEGVAKGDLPKLLGSGFQAANTERRSLPLEQPTGLVLSNGPSGQLIARVSPIKNTRLYEGRIKGPTGDWTPSVFTGDSRHIIFDGLTPGTNYTVQVRALGGSTGQSDWSDPSSHMAM